MTKEEVMGTQNRGFASMDEAKRKDIASRGGQASSGQFNSATASAAGKKGAAAQPREAKVKGGQNSRRSS